MRSLSTSAFGQPSETKEMRGAGRGAVSAMSVTPGPCHGRKAGASAPAPSHRPLRPQRHDAGRIDAPVALVIVMLDVEEVDRAGYSRPMVKLAQVSAQARVVPDLPQVALEVPEINGIEADQRGEQAPVRLREPVAQEKALALKARLEPVEGLEQGPERLLVSRLGHRESGAINPVVDGSVDAGVDLVDLGPKIARIVVARRGAGSIEGMIEHADDFRRFVVDDRVRLSVPQHRHCDAAAVVGPRLDVEGAQLLGAEDGVGNHARPIVEGPAALGEQPMDDRKRDHALETLKAAEDEGAVRPRAGERDDEMVAARLRLEAAD